MFSLEFLGSGTSVGVPVIGCDCGVCQSTDPLNKRLRSAALVRAYGPAGELASTVVIDTPPDFREQMLRAQVRHLDGIVLTHYHADHVVGIDDVRRFNALQKKVIDCWAAPETLAGLRRSFGYVLSEHDELRSGLPCVKPCLVEPGASFQIGALKFQPIELDHVVLRTLGFRISMEGCHGDLAYCLDFKRISAQSIATLRGVDTLVLDMLREAPNHPTHLVYREALELVRQIQPRRTVFSHLGHEIEHRSFEQRLGATQRLAYDGLVLRIE